MGALLVIAGVVVWALLVVVWCWRLPAGARWLDWAYPLLPLCAAVPMLIGVAWPWLQAWLYAGVFLWAGVSVTWLLSLLKRDASIMDMAFGLLLLALPWWLQWRNSVPVEGSVAMLLVCSTLGFGRFTVHIVRRNLPHGEDPRYARWRQRHGSGWWWWSYFQIFLLQGVILWLWSLPLVLVLSTPSAVSGLQWVGAAVWLVGFVFEAGGDWQLERFKRRRSDASQLLDTGLWALTRHPNYFGQAAMWWGYGVLAFAHPVGALVVPVLLHVTWLMHQGSATSLMERHMHKTKPGYAAYCARVPIFFPRWPGSRVSASTEHTP